MAGIKPRNGMTVGMGSLPHRDLDAAVEFALRASTVATVPSLPRRSPAEGLIAQAVVGIDGVSLGQYGSISVDAARLDPSRVVHTDLGHEAFEAFRAFLAAAPAHAEPGRPMRVKWQLVGPVTLGTALARAGVSADDAFEIAVLAVRAHLQHLLDAVDLALPGCEQLVFVDEPDLTDLTDPAFPIAPDTAIDLVSGALAAIETRAASGLSVGPTADWASMIAAGPKVLCVPVQSSIVEAAGHLAAFLERGGVIAWGAVHTDGPIATTAERPWRQLSDLWCQLVERGCDQIALRQQCMITPAGGLGSHTPAVAERVMRVADEIGRRVRDQATASRFVLGA
ncbi:MAG: hypothetical protein ACOYL9_06775 [Ilumatobacteraceae bacterium]|jgi:hypothetical protein